MNSHRDWTSAGFSLPPVAPVIGPFGLPGFLSTLWENLASEEAELCIFESDDALAALTIGHGRLEFVGHRDLVDYRSPLGGGAADLFREVVDSVPPGTRILFDSLPEEAVEPIGSGLGELGLDHVVTVHTTAAVLSLPDSFDDYLTSIGKKERHELRRKRRRFEASGGSLDLQRATTDGEAFRRFVDLHRRSDGEKGSFMTDRMERFFAALYALPGWEIDSLVTEAGEVTAAAFGYVDESGYYLYNSAFSPDLRHLSPGQVMLGALIERAIGERRRFFDFLKGEEPYKYRLGATERPLYEILAVR